MRSLLRIPIKILRSALLSVQTNFTLAEMGQRPARNQHTCKPDAQGRALRRRRLGHQYHLGSARPDSGRTGGCGRVRRFQGQQPGEHRTYLRDNQLAKHVFGLDSFQGFDESVEKDIALGGAADAEKRVGGFEATSLARVRAKLAGLGLVDAVTLIPGYFVETLEKLPEKKYSFVHLDCDIYDSYRQTLRYFYGRMSPGGIILFDEYDDPPWPGCNLAVDEFLADKPEKPVVIQMDNYEKYYIQKDA